MITLIGRFVAFGEKINKFWPLLPQNFELWKSEVYDCQKEDYIRYSYANIDTYRKNITCWNQCCNIKMSNAAMPWQYIL